MGTITTIEVQKRNKERANLYLDGEYAFSLSLVAAAQLRKGQMLTQTEIDALQHSDAITQAVDKAAHFLAYRPRSEQEVRRNLAQKKFPEAIIEAAIERLHELTYLNDEAFARFWMENRQQFKPRSPMALRHELRQKGVANHVIELVLADVDTEDAAYRAAQERVRRLKGLDRQTFRKKLGGFLQRRGFAYGMSNTVIQRLEEELVAEDPAYFPIAE